jgi:uncharacterized protein
MRPSGTQPSESQREPKLTPTASAVRVMSDARRSKGGSARLRAETAALEQREHLRGRPCVSERRGNAASKTEALERAIRHRRAAAHGLVARVSRVSTMTGPIWTLLRVASVVLALIGSATAGPLEDASKALEGGDYAAALRLYRPLADRGDLDAQFAIGQMYTLGHGVRVDNAEAYRWYRRAAEHSDKQAKLSMSKLTVGAIAELNVANSHANGLGVPRNFGEAIKWYRSLAERGLDIAQDRLAEIYTGRTGGPKNLGEAYRWYHRAADQGLARAQLALAMMYESGDGVIQDFVEAHKWLNLAAAHARQEETTLRDTARKLRDELAGLMTATQIAEAQQLAREWKPER